jgi:hypothetical protein
MHLAFSGIYASIKQDSRHPYKSRMDCATDNSVDLLFERLASCEKAKNLNQRSDKENENRRNELRKTILIKMGCEERMLDYGHMFGVFKNLAEAETALEDFKNSTTKTHPEYNTRFQQLGDTVLANRLRVKEMVQYCKDHPPKRSRVASPVPEAPAGGGPAQVQVVDLTQDD